MPKGNDASAGFIGGYEQAIPEANLEDNHASKSGGPELAEVAGGVKGSYGGRDSAIPSCYYEDNHAKGGGKIEKLGEED